MADNLIGGVALNRADGGRGHILNNTGMYDLAALFEKYLIAGFWRFIVSALRLIVSRGVRTSRAEIAGLTFHSLRRFCVLAAKHIEKPINKTVAPCVPVFVAVVVSGGGKIAGVLCPVAGAGVCYLAIELRVARFFMVAELGYGERDQCFCCSCHDLLLLFVARAGVAGVILDLGQALN